MKVFLLNGALARNVARAQRIQRRSRNRRARWAKAKGDGIPVALDQAEVLRVCLGAASQVVPRTVGTVRRRVVSRFVGALLVLRGTILTARSEWPM